MKIYLHSDNAERSASYIVNVAPAADLEFHSAESYRKRKEDKASFPREWLNADDAPKQLQVKFVFGAAEVEDTLGRYMVAREIAHSSRLIRKVRQLFTRSGEPIEEAFDEHGRSVPLHAPA